MVSFPTETLLKDRTGGVSDSDVENTEHRRAKLWKPFHLRLLPLLGFAALCVCMGTALGILASIARRNDGISAVSRHLRYLWTYGPTAMFTLLSLLFAGTVQSALQLQAWKNMWKRSRPASETVLLDYISQWNVFALAKAVRRRHALAALAISASFLLQLMVILSTALFIPHNTTTTRQGVELDLLEQFAASTGLFGPNSTDIRPMAAVLGLADYNLSLPSGMTKNSTFLRFRLPSNSGITASSIQADVAVFSSDLYCEEAAFRGQIMRTPWDYVMAPNGSQSQINWQTFYHYQSVSTSTCDAKVDFRTYQVFNDTYIDSNIAVVQCTTYPANDAVHGKRLALYAATVTPAPNGSIPSTNTAGLLCTPQYKIQRTPVRIDQSGSATVLDQGSATSPHHIENLSSWDIVESFIATLGAIAPLLGFNSGISSFAIAKTGLLEVYAPQRKVADWVNAALINSTITEFWATWTAQNAALHYKQSLNRTIFGQIVTQQSRLIMSRAVFWTIEGCLLCLVITVVFLAVSSREAVLPRDPTCAGGLAAMIGGNREFMAAFKGSSRSHESEIMVSLDGSRFAAGIQNNDDGPESPHFCLEWSMDGSSKPAPHAPDTPEKIRWQSNGIGPLFISGVCLLLLALIGVLEALLRISNAHEGMLQVGDPQTNIHFAWTILPALVMVATAAVVGVQKFAAWLLYPYQHLKSGSVSARVGLFKYSFNSSSFSSIAEAIRDMELTMLMAILSTVLASFLTIAISGLFSAIAVTNVHSVRVNQLEWFDHNTTNITEHSALQIELVTMANLSYPQFTYDNYALPALQAPSGLATGRIDALIPALQGVMNCSLIPPEDIITVNNTWYHGSWTNVALVALRNRDNCLWQFDQNAGPICKDGPYGGGHVGTFRNSSADVRGLEAPGGMCTAYDPLPNKVSFVYHVNPITGVTNYPYLNVSTSGYFGYVIGSLNSSSKPLPPGCPSNLVVLGRTTNHLITDASVFTCSPYVQKVTVNSSFLPPDMKIDPSSPPRLVEGSVEPFEFIMPNAEAYQGLQAGNIMNSFEQIEIPLLHDSEKLGPFISILSYGSNGIPISELVGASNADKFITASNHLYGVGMAQMLDNARQSLPDGDNEITATHTAKDIYRLTQSKISTRILQGLLAAILVLVILTHLTLGTRPRFRVNPCSIAGMTVLLADSELLDKNIIPSGAEWLTDEELMSNKVFGGWVFSLGWWQDPNGRRRYGIDIGMAEGAGAHTPWWRRLRLAVSGSRKKKNPRKGF